jgi:hypothetical protein
MLIEDLNQKKIDGTFIVVVAAVVVKGVRFTNF